jgi:hyperosmotically inducible protein
MRRALTSLSVLLVPLALSTGCQTMTGKSFGQNIDDRAITAGVKTRLIADRARNLTSIDVDTNQGIVYLTGNVATAAQKTDAERIARSVNGVERVVNNLMTEPHAVGSAPPATAPGGKSSAVSASPTTGAVMGRHTMTGEVTKIDRTQGHLQLKTAEGEVELHFPPATLQNVNEGDRIAVDVSMRPVR